MTSGSCSSSVAAPSGSSVHSPVGVAHGVATDCMIAIGCRFSDRITGDTRYFATDCKLIHADIDPSEIGKNVKVNIPIVGDAKNVIKMLNVR